LARAHDFGADGFSRGESELRLPYFSVKLGTMNDVTNWKVPKWPFLLADALLMFFAYYYVLHAALPIHHWEIAAGCVALGAVLGVIPFYLDYRAMGRALEIHALGAVTEKIKNLEKLSEQINSATNHWAVIQDSVQAEAEKTTAAARQIADKMAEEARQFSDFMQKVNDSEKATLRLEVEKLHRAEGEWLQALVRVLDHVFALHTGAVRTGDQKFIEPITNFQSACRETVRRLGLTPFVAETDEPFNTERHQVAGAGSTTPPKNGVVAETVGTGYTFQGKLLRPAIVRLHEANKPAAKPEASTKPAPAVKSDDETADAELPL
jgi:molecular chaperone GrpE (heat shock protein)